LLVERFLKSFVVRLEKPSVMHYFDGWFSEVYASSSWAIYHDGHLLVAARLNVSGGDSSSDWVIVGGDVARFTGHGIQMSLLHFETIRICPECLIGVEAVVQPPVDCNVLALMIIQGDSTKLHIKLDQVIETLAVSHFHQTILF
jgi:hypothetical protein